MATLSIDEEKLKDLLKSALAEAFIDEEKLKDLFKAVLAVAFVENRDLVRDIVEEVVEDIALARAIGQGLDSKPVPRDEVFTILESSR